MIIVILDANTLGEGIDFSVLEPFGELRIYGYTDSHQMNQRIQDADVLIANKFLFNEKTLAKADRLKLICLTATGSNNVDLAYTNSRGIRVCNVVGYSTDSVVQHTFSMLFYLVEQMAYYEHYVKNHHYVEDYAFSHYKQQFHEIAGKTFGIIGLGAIGSKVAQIAELFGARIIYYSTSGIDRSEVYERTDLDTLLKESDIVSIHAPLTEKTYHLLDKKAFNSMKPSAYLLNLGRGDIIVEDDLVEALLEGQIAGAGLDVLSVEPMASDSPFLKIIKQPNLLITPHIGWASIESRNRVIEEISLNIQAFIEGKERCIVTQ